MLQPHGLMDKYHPVNVLSSFHLVLLSHSLVEILAINVQTLTIAGSFVITSSVSGVVLHSNLLSTLSFKQVVHFMIKQMVINSTSLLVLYAHSIQVHYLLVVVRNFFNIHHYLPVEVLVPILQ